MLGRRLRAHGWIFREGEFHKRDNVVDTCVVPTPAGTKVSVSPHTKRRRLADVVVFYTTQGKSFEIALAAV
jgi:hypothetical protein